MTMMTMKMTRTKTTKTRKDDEVEDTDKDNNKYGRLQEHHKNEHSKIAVDD
jgi:hypothetical protein